MIVVRFLLIAFVVLFLPLCSKNKAQTNVSSKEPQTVATPTSISDVAAFIRSRSKTPIPSEPAWGQMIARVLKDTVFSNQVPLDSIKNLVATLSLSDVDSLPLDSRHDPLDLLLAVLIIEHNLQSPGIDSSKILLLSDLRDSLTYRYGNGYKAIAEYIVQNDTYYQWHEMAGQFMDSRLASLAYGSDAEKNASILLPLILARYPLYQDQMQVTVKDEDLIALFSNSPYEQAFMEKYLNRLEYLRTCKASEPDLCLQPDSSLGLVIDSLQKIYVVGSIGRYDTLDCPCFGD